MDSILFEKLIDNHEGWTIDYKSQQYDLSNDGKKACFIKDIISMANTVRECTSYIIIGVQADVDGKKDLIGVSEHHDDGAIFQTIIKDKVFPVPKFVYYPFEYKGLSFGVFEIPVVKGIGPCQPVKDYGGVLKRHEIYYRQGSSNEPASYPEVLRIFKWLHGEGLDETVDYDAEVTIPGWAQFYRACSNFDNTQKYILIVGPDIKVSQEQLKAFGAVDWSLVFDFNPSSELDGILSAVTPSLSLRRSIHLITCENNQSLVPDRATYWYAANGLIDNSSMVTESWREWNRKYNERIRETLLEFYRQAGEMPVTVIVLWDSNDYVAMICNLIDSIYGDAASFVIAIPETNILQQLASNIDASLIQISLPQILDGLRATKKATTNIYDEIWLPCLAVGTSTPLPIKQLRWIEEDLEVLHLNVGYIDKNISGIKDFYRGRVITWSELGLDYDVRRDLVKEFKKKVEYSLQNRLTKKINLFHYAGAGGTTLGRRLCWDLHETYPSVTLKKYRQRETIERLREIFRLTQQSILILVECAEINLDEVDKLITELKSRQVPATLLLVQRCFTANVPAGEFFLDSILRPNEKARFLDAYSREVPEKRHELKQFIDLGQEKLKTPFYFGLITFEKDFVNIQGFVFQRLSRATEIQRQILTYISLCYYYSQQPVNSQLFSRKLHCPDNRKVLLERVLSTPLLELVTCEYEYNWRPTHQLIAEEIVKQVLSGNSTDEHVWKQMLATWANGLIEIISVNSKITTKESIDLLKRLFVIRDNQDLLGKDIISEETGTAVSKFSRFIEDIPSLAGRQQVLINLTEKFPEEAHFWAHLSRFYSIQEKDPDKALIAINKAIEIADEEDHSLYHMRGMCYRAKLYMLMEEIKFNGSTVDEKIQMIKPIVSITGEQFEKVREIDKKSEYGYISHIQMLLEVLDFGFIISGKQTRTELLIGNNGCAIWLREVMDLAQDLLERARRVREGEPPSSYIRRLRVALEKLNDNHSKMVEGLTNLLGCQDIYQPTIRRQLVRAYLLKNGNSWDNFNQKELDRILDYLQANIIQEPTVEQNLRLWFQAARKSTRQKIDGTIEKLSVWRAMSSSLDAIYYLYILYTIKVLEGSKLSLVYEQDLLNECSRSARHLRNRTFCFEWWGDGIGLQRIVHHSQLGERDTETDFYKNISLLCRVEGRISKIEGPEAGEITLKSGLKAFFVPARGNFIKGRDENQLADFFLGFSYDGLRAWNVSPCVKQVG
ncbi:MAG: ATP-binding protein [Smithella sp.]